MGVKQLYDLTIPMPGRDGKTNWVKHGVAMMMDDGRLAVKLESLPLGATADRDGGLVPWDGWFKVFEQKSERGGNSRSSGSAGSSNRSLNNDDIPF